MKFTTLKSLVAGGLVLGAVAAQAAVPALTFSTSQALSKTYSEDGFTLSSNSKDLLVALGVLGSTDGKTLTLATTTPGKTFDLASLQLSSLLGFNDVSVTLGWTGATSGSEVVKLGSTLKTTSFLDLTDLSTFTITGSSSSRLVSPTFQVDNVYATIDTVATPLAVPEPASVLLLVAGLAMVGTVAMRRKV